MCLMHAFGCKAFLGLFSPMWQVLISQNRKAVVAYIWISQERSLNYITLAVNVCPEGFKLHSPWSPHATQWPCTSSQDMVNSCLMSFGCRTAQGVRLETNTQTSASLLSFHGGTLFKLTE